ncbi:unnamed protein product [Symbiodinium sp. CCMP2592]|nr:unnamed protein product [Symbiodinium sp. CCMP2592]
MYQTLTVIATTDLQLPWETGAFNFVCEDRTFLDDLQDQLLAQPAAVPLPRPTQSTQSAEVSAPVAPKPRLRALGQWQPQDSQAERQAALSKWSQLLRAVPHFFQPETVSEVANESSRVELGNLDLRFAKKSTNTLLNRISSLQRFAAWCLKAFPHEPLSEPLVFLYCQHVTSQQPSSSAPDQLCQALNFSQGCLGLQTPASSLVSPRVQGIAHQSLRQQKPSRQAPALTTDQVRWLQSFSVADESQYECYLASTFLFMVYARARHSDLKRSKKLTVDRDDEGNVVFLECSVLNPKQSKSSRRRNMFLPIVAPAEGICSEPWAARWLELRQDLGLVCEGSLTDSPLLPELAADGSLLPVNMDSATASKWLRCLLSKQPGSSLDDILQMSSQGLKATCLSWTMKAGIPDPDQTLLGYHSRGKSSSAMSYGRDSLAGPLRHLAKVLQDVKEGKFKPDSTRSGRWQAEQSTSAAAASSAAPKPLPTKPLLEPAAPQQSSDSSSDEELESDGSSAEDVQLLQSVSHSLALVASSSDFQFLTNVRSGVVHVSRVGQDRLLCGRTVFAGLQITAMVDFSKVQACLTCQSVADGLIDGQWASTDRGA